MRPIVKIHGGKGRIYKFILDSIPKDTTHLIDVFGGAGSVTLNASTDFIHWNDLDTGLYALMFHIKYEADNFAEQIKNIQYCQGSFDMAKDGLFEESVNTYVLNRMSRGGLGKDFAWSDRQRGGKPGDVNAWDTAKKLIPKWSQSLEHVKLTNLHYTDLLSYYDSEYTEKKKLLMYLDPPYLPEVRTAKNCYKHEMDYNQHEEMLQQVVSLSEKFSFLISGYDSALYNNVLSGWNTKTMELANNSDQSTKKSRRVEKLWYNY